MSAGQGGVRSFKRALAIHQEQVSGGEFVLSKPKALLVKVARGEFRSVKANTVSHQEQRLMGKKTVVSHNIYKQMLTFVILRVNFNMPTKNITLKVDTELYNRYR